MRALLLSLLLLSACKQQEQQPNAVDAPVAAMTGVYAGTGRDRLCYNADSKRMGMITFGAAETNCAIRGSFDGSSVKPDGDTKCQVPVAIEGNRITLINQGGAECAYYCGPNASYAGKTFDRMDNQPPATDIAGDPLC
ncbi:hypothetical protein V6R86_11325 [Sphingomonas kaistensis]|uniref:Lipoprotein n=1 Tax=Sphingomonas kaistensis TaxID=298708 RepID=A0ABZ2G534_9SPHN